VIGRLAGVASARQSVDLERNARVWRPPCSRQTPECVAHQQFAATFPPALVPAVLRSLCRALRDRVHLPLGRLLAAGQRPEERVRADVGVSDGQPFCRKPKSRFAGGWHDDLLPRPLRQQRKGRKNPYKNPGYGVHVQSSFCKKLVARLSRADETKSQPKLRLKSPDWRSLQFLFGSVGGASPR
jgi:hypothetical protein